MQEFLFDVGDTNFLAIVNPDTYCPFVDEDWTLDDLEKHWNSEAKSGNILVFGMTQEGIEDDWRIGIDFGAPKKAALLQEN